LRLAPTCAPSPFSSIKNKASTTTLEAEATTAALQLALTTTFSCVPPSPSSGGDTAVDTTWHTQVYGVQNIRSLVSSVLDPSSIGYAQWCGQVLLSLKHYDLADYVLSDAPPINDPTWECMESVVLYWIFGTITGKLQDIAKEHKITACQIWRMIEHKFIGNSETCALHLDAVFHNFIQGDFSVRDYCLKMKSMVDSLGDLGCTVSDCNLILNVLRGLNKRYDHLWAMITCSMPFPSFHKVRDDMVQEEITLDLDTPASPL
jgi:hypothetical protein